MNKSLYVLPFALILTLSGAARAEDNEEALSDHAVEQANLTQDPISSFLQSFKGNPAKPAIKESVKAEHEPVAAKPQHKRIAKNNPVPMPVARPNMGESDLPVKAEHLEPNMAPKVAANPHLPNPMWGATAERREWTFTVEGVVAKRLSDLELARDKEAFCPGYSKAGHSQRVNCWVMLVSAVSKFESGFKTSDSFRETDGNDSIGLLALSPGECPNAKTARALSGARPNLICGVNMMAKLVAQDHFISGPSERRGASRYWSTLRAPYKVYDHTRHKNLNLGYKSQVVSMTRGYRGNGKPPAVETTSEIVSDAGEVFEAADHDLADKEHQDLTNDRDFFEPRF